MPSKWSNPKAKKTCKVCGRAIYLADNGHWNHFKVHVGAAKFGGSPLTLDDQMKIAELLQEVIGLHDAEPK